MEFFKWFIVLFFVKSNLALAADIKIGILYDAATKSLADDVESTALDSSTPDTAVTSTKILTTQHRNLSNVVLGKNFTALLSVTGKLECGNLTDIEKLVPIYSVSRTLHSCDGGDTSSNIAYLFPPSSSLISAITTTATLYGWNKAVVFEEESSEIQFSFSDMQYAREHGIEIIAYKANGDEESLIRTMKLARKEGLRAYILSSPAVSALRIMEIAQKKQLATTNFHWFLPNVFVDPDRFLEFAQNGVRMSFLSSPVITPLVRGLMTRYTSRGAGLNVTSDVVYNDVIKSLAKLVVEKLVEACGSGDCGASSPTGKPLCGVWKDDVHLTPRISTERSLKKREVAESDPAASPRDACELNVHRNTPCQRISKILTQGSPFTSMEERKHKVQVETLDTLMARGATGDDELRSKRDIHQITTTNLSECPSFEFSENMVEYITDSSKSTSALTFNYQSTSNFCSNDSTNDYAWSYRNESCSQKFVQATEMTYAGSLFITEITSAVNEEPRNIVLSGMFDGSRSSLNVSYSPFSVTDIQLPNRPLLVCAVWQPPWLSWEIDEKTEELQFEGYLFEVLNHLSKSMNFTYEMVMNNQFNSGHRLTEDELERAMYENFENDSCDFFLHTKSIRGGRMGRAGTVELSLAFQQPSMFLLTKRLEKAESIDIWQFMTPFHEESWIYLWSSYILVSLFMAWINTKNPNEYEKISASFGPDSEPADHLGVLNSLWFNFSSIVQQGVDIVPRSKAAKVLTAGWWFFGLTIITAYTANMTLFMTQVNKRGIETLDELAGQKEFAYGMMYDNPMLTLFLPDAKERPYTLLYNYLKKEWNNSVFDSHQQAFDKILAGNFFLMASFETTVEALTTSCEFDKVGTGFYKYQFALPFPKGSLLIPLFNDHIARLRDRGTLSMLEEKWFSLEAKCENTNVAKTLENQLDIKAFTGMYVFLIIGCSIGIFICISEIAWVRFGGVTGMVGKARKYELKENRRENRKTLLQLEEEFEKWEGGWEVWKFREWSNHGNPNAMNEQQRNAVLTEKIRESTMKYAQHTCQVCGKTVKPKTDEAAAYRCNIVTTETEKKKELEIESPDSGRSSAASGLSVEEKKTVVATEKRGKHDDEGGFEPDANLPIPLPMINTGVDRESPQITTRADVFRHKMSLCNVSSVQSHSSLASGPLSIPGISASDWTVSTKPGDSMYDVTIASTIAPPSGFTSYGRDVGDDDHYYEVTSSGRSSDFYEDDSWTEGGDSPRG